VWWPGLPGAGPPVEGPHAQHPGGGLDPPGSGVPADGGRALTPLASVTSERPPACVVLCGPPALEHRSGDDRSSTAVAQRLEHHPRHPWLLVDSAPVGGVLPRVAAAASAAISTPSRPQVVLRRPARLGGVALVVSESSRHQDRRWGGWRSLANGTMAAP